MLANPIVTYLVEPARPPIPLRERVFVRLTVPVALVGLVTVLRWPFERFLGLQSPFLFYYPVVVASAWIAGLGAGLFATVLASLVVDYYWMLPRYTLTATPPDAVRLALFVLASATAVVLLDRLQRAERGEREAKEQLRMALANLGDAVVITDASGRVLFLNGKAQLVTGWRSDEVVGRPFDGQFFFLDPKDRRAGDNRFRLGFLDMQSARLPEQVVLVSKGGKRHILEPKVTRIVDRAARNVGCVILLHDQERKQGAPLPRAA
jgi:PAS domain S-box-containing protein